MPNEELLVSRRLLSLLLVPLALLLASSNLAPPARPLNWERPPMPVSEPTFGLNSHLATRYPDPTSMHIPGAALTDLGVQWVREDFHWHRIQPERDVWDWSFNDAAVRELVRRDIQILGVLGPSVGWATPYTGDQRHAVSYYAPDPDLFEDYVRGVVARYRRYVKHWEIWNEPDHALFWQPAPDPVAYAHMLMRVSRVIKEIDSEARVVIGGFNPYDPAFIRTVAQQGAWSSFDILAIHPYIDPATPEQGNLVAAVDTLYALMYQYGQKPIWVTEIGWASGPGDRDRVGYTNEQQQAHYLVRSMLLLWSAGVERIFWYMLKDDQHNPYGLVRYGNGRTDFAPELYKPAYFALQTLHRELQGAQFVERRDLFDAAIVTDFSQAAGWVRPAQPNGSLSFSDAHVARIDYNFSTRANDYLVFELAQPIPLRGDPYAIGLWVYGDGSEHLLRVWLRDAEGEVLQYKVGVVGEPGWRFISTPLGGTVEPGNRVTSGGNGQLDYPISLQAILLDDAYDAFIGTGTIYLDDVKAIYGREVYDLRFTRAGRALDVIWSPPHTRVTLATNASTAYVRRSDGRVLEAAVRGDRIPLTVSGEPVFLWHTR